LTSLDGLAALTSVDGAITIMSNVALPTCLAIAFLDQIPELHTVCLQDNLADGCTCDASYCDASYCYSGL